MGLSIHTNFASMTTQSQLNTTNKMLGTAMQRLGTGLRINSAADDAAGLQIATRLQAQSNGQKVGMRNAQDAISMMQTAEGAMDEMTNITQRMKDLATQAANGTNSDKDIAAMNAEFKELGAELANIRDNTSFGGTKLLEKGGKFEAGAVSFQIGASTDEVLAMNAKDKVQAVNSAISTAVAADLTATSTAASAQITAMDTMLEKIGEARSTFGANINRLDHTINNLSNMKENTDMANGRIMDADFAQETTSMTKNQMLMQAGMSVLSNSNQMTGMVTSLLR
ncbi:lateral flagellin LafA [Aeromonas enteropelogenes]|uniref:lateral flagellin LafA n=1 Tax=Aeromonas enteropelogenes TaxID=29489 RepID=UPI003BA029FC